MFLEFGYDDVDSANGFDGSNDPLNLSGEDETAQPNDPVFRR
jgi:hypothetical protein